MLAREYPNISLRLNELMVLHDINDEQLSFETEINFDVIKKILNGKQSELCFRDLLKLSVKFQMLISEVIDYLSQ